MALATQPLARRRPRAQPDPTPPLEPGLSWLDAETLPPRGRYEALPALPDGERYTCVGELARGGMGAVFLVRDEHLGRVVAMKRLISANPSAEDVRRFLTEAQITGQLEHPNVVTVLDVGHDAEGRPYYTMPWIRGGTTLADVIDQLRADDPGTRQAWPLRRRVEAVLAVARALRAAHTRGVVHRDVKPANVMVGHHDEVLLLDWGLAKSTRQVDPFGSGQIELVTDPARTAHDTIVGTPLYMAPEQLRGDGDARADVYALAALLWELISLRHYLGRTPGETGAVLRAVRDRDPDLRRGHGQDRVPTPLQRLVGRGLAKDPQTRLPDTGALIAGLEAWLAGDPRVDCPNTLCLKGLSRWRRLLEDYPQVATAASFAVPPLITLGLVQLVRLATG